MGGFAFLSVLESSGVGRRGFDIFLFWAPNMANNICFDCLGELFAMVRSKSSFEIVLFHEKLKHMKASKLVKLDKFTLPTLVIEVTLTTVNKMTSSSSV